MTIPDELISTLGPVVESVGADLGRRYWKYGATQEDMAQQGWLWIFQHPAKVVEWFDDENFTAAAASRLLARSIRNECEQYGQDLKAQAVGYNRDDLAYYTRGMVRDLLPAMFDPESWLNPEVSADGERRTKSAAAEGGNWVATLADVSQAYAKLEVEDRDLLAAFHRDLWTNNMLAEAYGLPKQTMSDRHDRAVRRLVDALGGARPQWAHDADCEHDLHGWVGRRSLSNSQAQAIQSSYYEDE